MLGTAVRATGMLIGLQCLGASAALSQPAYPSRQVQIIVPFAPGGSIDVTFRIIAPMLSERLGQPVVIVNRAGGGATIGMNAVAKALPDGHTLGAASFAFAANPYVLGDSLPYDTVKDFAPITLVARSAMLMVVNKRMPAKSVREFIAYAKSRPGALNYGSVGIASSGHLITALFESLTDVKMTHVPFTTGPFPALVADHIQLQFGPIPSTLPFVRRGDLIALGVTSPGPDPSVPDVPPVSATVPGFETYEWPGLVAPAGTPRAIIDTIHQAIVKVLADREVRRRLEALGSQPVGSSPEEFGAFILKEMATWEKVAKRINTEEPNKKQ